MQGSPTLTEVQGLIPFLDWFYGRYGPASTLALIIGVPLIFVLFQIWQHIRKDREINAALKAKEETIQHLAEDNRMYRIVLFKEHMGWSDQDIERFVIKNQPVKPTKKAKRR